VHRPCRSGLFELRYGVWEIDALVVDGDMVAAAWTATLPNDAEFRGLSLYRASGGLLRSTRHAVIGNMPS
jgi:hypothetical protein